MTNTGTGQIIGLFEFGPYSPNSIYIYQTNAHLSTNIVVTPITVKGFNTTWNGQDDGEEAMAGLVAKAAGPSGFQPMRSTPHGASSSCRQRGLVPGGHDAVEALR